MVNQQKVGVTLIKELIDGMDAKDHVEVQLIMRTSHSGMAKFKLVVLTKQ